MKAFAKMRGHIPLEKMKKCRQAAYTYAGVKIALALVTFYFLHCPSCENLMRYSIRNVLHIMIIGHFISIGLPIAMRIIVVVYMAKTSIYLLNFTLPFNLSLPLPFIGSWQILFSDRAFNYAMIINLLLCGLMACMLLRAIEEMKLLKKEKIAHG